MRKSVVGCFCCLLISAVNFLSGLESFLKFVYNNSNKNEFCGKTTETQGLIILIMKENFDIMSR